MNDGGQAFPGMEKIFDRLSGNYEISIPGMSLRDWLAGMAMQGIISASQGTVKDVKISSMAYVMADAMLKEGSKK